MLLSSRSWPPQPAHFIFMVPSLHKFTANVSSIQKYFFCRFNGPENREKLLQLFYWNSQIFLASRRASKRKKAGRPLIRLIHFYLTLTSTPARRRAPWIHSENWKLKFNHFNSNFISSFCPSVSLHQFSFIARGDFLFLFAQIFCD